MARAIACLPKLIPCNWQQFGGNTLQKSRGVTYQPRRAGLPLPVAKAHSRILTTSTIYIDLPAETSYELGPKNETEVIYNRDPFSVAAHSAIVARGFEYYDQFKVALKHFSDRYRRLYRPSIASDYRPATLGHAFVVRPHYYFTY
jgi:hypothetical protein